jgi:hypothetical protein
MLEHSDGGGIYTLGNMPGSVIRGNFVHDNVNFLGGPGGLYLDEGGGYIEVAGKVVYNVSKAMNFDNRYQNRIVTCHVHDNYFEIKPTDRDFPQAVADKAGLEPEHHDLLKPDAHDQLHYPAFNILDRLCRLATYYVPGLVSKATQS